VNSFDALLASCRRDLASMRRNGADDPETRAAIALAEGPGEPCAANRQPQLLEAILVIKELAKYEGPFSADITRICETAIAKANETVPASAFPKYFPPWYVQHRDLVDVIRDRNNHLIAHCQPEHSGLFAAAPELLAACKELKDCLFRWMEIAEENDKRDYDDEAVAKATAAIAKAEGN